MGIADIVIIALIAALLIFAFRRMRKNTQGGCCGDCACCEKGRSGPVQKK